MIIFLSALLFPVESHPLAFPRAQSCPPPPQRLQEGQTKTLPWHPSPPIGTVYSLTTRRQLYDGNPQRYRRGSHPAARHFSPGLAKEPLRVLSGVVVKVTDGDTVQIDSSGTSLKVRLYGSDAPEVEHRNRKTGLVSKAG